jgi:hypothetical protein
VGNGGVVDRERSWRELYRKLSCDVVACVCVFCSLSYRLGIYAGVRVQFGLTCVNA